MEILHSLVVLEEKQLSLGIVGNVGMELVVSSVVLVTEIVAMFDGPGRSEVSVQGGV